MKSIRTKLILSLLLIALLPVFPIYFLVKNLLQQSLEVGYNENVEMALDHASRITRELYSKYRDESLSQAIRLASSPEIRQIFQSRTQIFADKNLGPDSDGKIDLYDLNGNRIYVSAQEGGQSYPELFQTNIMPLSRKEEPEILAVSNDTRYLVAFAPVRSGDKRLGSLIYSKAIDAEIARGSQQVVRINQMFKTLDFFESDLTTGFLRVFFIVYFPIALLSIALGIYFSRKITSPLLELVRGTQIVAAGDWDHRVQVKSKDEVGDLQDAFNEMIATLKQKQEQVIALEKMAAWREIARVLAHEIKNPLTPIQLTVQQLHDKYPGESPEYQQLLDDCREIINDEVESLRKLVREFSEFARMPQLHFEVGDLNQLIEEVCKLYSTEPVKFDLASDVPDVSFDHEQMRRVLINLIENSLHSIAQKGSGDVLVKTFVEKDNVILEHSDSGTGIPEDVEQKIFEPYFSTKKSGMGLGLAIVRRIVEEHDGAITLESQEGMGARFRIVLPTDSVLKPNNHE